MPVTQFSVKLQPGKSQVLCSGSSVSCTTRTLARVSSKKSPQPRQLRVSRGLHWELCAGHTLASGSRHPVPRVAIRTLFCSLCLCSGPSCVSRSPGNLCLGTSTTCPVVVSQLPKTSRVLYCSVGVSRRASSSTYFQRQLGRFRLWASSHKFCGCSRKPKQNPTEGS